MNETTKVIPKTLILVGIKGRTSNKREADPSTAIIGSTLARYAQESIPEKIPLRKKAGVTYCVYTEYESDHTGEYTYFVGEEVNELSPELIALHGLQSICIPAQSYTVYTTDPGVMPAVVIDAWRTIWNTPFKEKGVERSYQADFEVYDERASNPQASVVDIYIGSNSKE